MRRRRSLQTRLNRLSPAPVGGGVLFVEDIESGAVRFEDLPTRGGGYLFVHRPCKTIEEWVKSFGGIRPPAPIIIL